MCRNSNTRLLMRFIIDFVVLVGICCVALIVLPRTLTTAHSGFFCNDAALRYPYKTTGLMLSQVHITILVIAVPAALILVVEMLRAAFATTNGKNVSARRPQQFYFVGMQIPTFISECYEVVGVYLFGLALEMILTQVTKHGIGRLRPYFFDVCQPQPLHDNLCTTSSYVDVADDNNNNTITTLPTNNFIEEYSCLALAASNELLSSMRHSFPSGYTASTSYAMSFLIFYLQARLTANWLHMLRSTLQFICSILVVLVATERSQTYRNHATDIYAGALIGFAFAVFNAFVVVDFFERTPKQRNNATVHEYKQNSVSHRGTKLSSSQVVS